MKIQTINKLNLKINVFVLVVILVCFFSCSDESEIQFEEVKIDADMLNWIAPFSDLNQQFSYSCDSVLNSGKLLVKHVNDRVEVSKEFCLPISDHERGECQNRTVMLNDKNNNTYYLTFWVFAEDWMNINPSSSPRLVKEIIRYHEYTRDIEEVCPNIYSVKFDSLYTYNNSINEAIIIEDTLSINSTVPKKFVLVKGIGIAEWEDYSSNIYKLE